MGTITLRVPDEKKEEWDAYHQREFTDPRNRTDLIERAVTLYIERDGGDQPSQFAESERLNNLEASVASLEKAMDGISRDLREIKRHVAQPDADLQEIAHDVMKILPSTDDVDLEEYGQAVMPSTRWDAGESEPDATTIPNLPSSAHEIRRYLEVGEYADYGFDLSDGDVEDALEYLRDQHLARRVDEERWVKDV